jgi:hypothetical protein
MSEQSNPIKRMLLWLSGAPAEQTPQAIPTPPAAETDPAQPAEPPGTALPEPTAAPPTVEPAPERAVDSALPSPAQPRSGDPVNGAVAYGVRVVPADVPDGAPYWRTVRVHHLTPDENQGRQHIFLDALDEAGARNFGAQASVTWPGGQATITVEKPVGEPGANFPLWKWQVAAVEMLGLPSDRVENLHTGHPDEPPGLGNTLFHHSFEVVYQQAVAGAVPLPPPDDKLIERYVLFGPPASPRTAVYLELARGYLQAQQPAAGYSADEAGHARRVVVVGELQDVSQEVEDALRQAGCQVQRVQGTPEEIVAAFTAIKASP